MTFILEKVLVIINLVINIIIISMIKYKQDIYLNSQIKCFHQKCRNRNSATLMSCNNPMALGVHN